MYGYDVWTRVFDYWFKVFIELYFLPYANIGKSVNSSICRKD